MLVLLLAYEGVFADPSFSWPTRPIGKQPKHMARLEVWVEEYLLFGAEFISRKDKPYIDYVDLFEGVLFETPH